MVDKRYDNLEIRCPRLGHPVPFSYCRVENSGLPCPRIKNCWEREVPVSDFIEANYTKEEQHSAFAERKDRIQTIFDIIQKHTRVPPQE
ncbi:MAG: hypothetical protein ACLFQK_05570 [Fibrobacterota bacterium]